MILIEPLYFLEFTNCSLSGEFRVGVSGSERGGVRIRILE
jgi:hypothetical protein